uniref:RNase NYN domain-containing protein n=1 Tax=Panagrolaimus sp. ES5 TaxID=591445 RepID=A0AC34FS35_9BILA
DDESQEDNSGIFCTDPSNENASSEVPSSVKGEQLRRMILIDGFNVMHHFKDMTLQSSAMFDEQMSPLILIPLICGFLQNGYVVRLILKNMPDHKKVSDLYILELLQKKGMCMFPEDDDTEKDDLLLLGLAKKYGALIISRDQFRNHREYDDIRINNRIEYDKVATGHFKTKKSCEILKHSMAFKYALTMNEFADKFIVDPSDDDYELVQKSLKEFKQVSMESVESLNILLQYVYCYWRYVYNYGIPDCVKPFISKTSFPMTFEDFEFAYHEYEEEERKHQLLPSEIPVNPLNDMSDDEFDPGVAEFLKKRRQPQDFYG